MTKEQVFREFEVVRRTLLKLSRRARTVKSRMFFQHAGVSLTFRRRIAPWCDRRDVPSGLLVSGGFGYFAAMATLPQWLLDLQIWPSKNPFR